MTWKEKYYLNTRNLLLMKTTSLISFSVKNINILLLLHIMETLSYGNFKKERKLFTNSTLILNV